MPPCRLAALFLHEDQRQGGDRRRHSGGAGGDLRAINLRPLAAMRDAEATAEAVVNPPGLCFPTFGARDDDPEWRLPAGEIAGPVDRIDDPARAIEPVQYARVRMRGFLAHEGKRIVERGQALAQQRLALLVGYRDGIVAALVLDFTRGKVAVARHDRLLGDPLHQREDVAVERAHER